MNPNSAYKLITIEKGIDYAPENVYIKHGAVKADVYGGKTPPIFAVLCTKSTGDGYCKIKLLGDEHPVEMLSQSFRQGVVYYIYIKELVEDDGGNLKFVGFQYPKSPGGIESF